MASDTGPAETEDILPGGPGGKLDTLLEALSLAGLMIGPRERVAAARLVIRAQMDARLKAAEEGAATGAKGAGEPRGAGLVIAADDEAGDVSGLAFLRSLRPLLAPLLARSPQERQEFFRIFDRVMQAPVEKTDRKDPEVGLRPKKPWVFPAASRVIAIVLALMVVFLASWFALTGSVPEEDAPGPEPAAGDSGSSVIERVAPAAPAPELEDRAVQADDRLLQRVLLTASQHAHAPTLEELANGLSMDREFPGNADPPPITALEGHGGTVWSAAFSRDGTRIVTASNDDTARLWREGEDGAWTSTPLEGHGNSVISAAFSPDGTRIVTASMDNTARVWRKGEDGAWTSTQLEGHQDTVISAAFSPDGTRIVTASYDDTARVWREAEDGNWTSTPLEGHQDTLRSAAFSPDGTRIVTASGDNTARVWREAEDGNWTSTPLEGHSSWVGSAAFSPDGTRIVSASSDYTARVWREGEDGVWTSTPLEGHENYVLSAAFSPDGTRIVTASSDNTARVWRETEDGAWTSTRLEGHGDAVLSAAFSPDGTRIVSASDDYTARVWREGEDGNWTSTQLEGHGSGVTSAAFSPDGTRIVTASEDNTARVWNLAALSSPADPWTAQSYALRLSELTGLPSGRPVPVFGEDGASSRNWVQIALAVARIEQPGAAPARLRLEQKAAAALAAADPPRSARILAELRRNAGAYEGLGRLDLLEQLSALPDIGPGPAEDADRALGVLADPALAPPVSAWKSEPPPPASSVPPRWLPWAAAAVPLVLLMAFLSRYAIRRPYLRQRAPRYPPEITRLVSDAGRAIRTDASRFQRAAQRLLVRSPGAGARLDIPATVTATLGAGGLWVEPVFTRARRRPEYLVLIEREAAGDQNAARMRGFAERMKDVIHLDIFHYQTEPGELAAAEGAERLSIGQAQSRFPDHRLIIFGSGRAFIDPSTGEARQSARELMYWERRALLTPVPLSEWGAAEFTLAQQLGLPIGRATPEGIEGIAELLGLEGAEAEDRLSTRGDGLARPLPDLLRLQPQRFLISDAPDAETLSDLMRLLRNGLDPASFDWFAALAVYPALQWDLTLYLGLSLPRRAGGNPDTDALYSEARLSALTQLPWLRYGRMPNWLRRALIAELSPARRGEVHKAIEAMIEAARPKAEADVQALEARMGRDAPRNPEKPERLLEDEVLLDFLARPEREDLSLKRFSRLLEFFRLSFWEQFGLPERLTALASLGYILAAFVMSPRAADGHALTGAWTPLLILLAGGLVTLFLWRPSTHMARIGAGLERAAPAGLALFLFGLGGLLRQYSGDGGSGDAALSSAGPSWPGAEILGGLLSSARSLPELPLWLAPALMIPALLVGRFLADRAGLRIFAPVLSDRTGWPRLVFNGAGLALLAGLVTWLSPGLAPGLLAGGGFAVFLAGCVAARFAPGARPLAWHARARTEAGWTPQAGRAILAALPLALAGAFFVSLNLGQARFTAGMAPTLEARAPDDSLVAYADAQGRVGLLSAAHAPLAAPYPTGLPSLAALAAGGTPERPLLAYAALSGEIYLREGAGSAEAVNNPGTANPLAWSGARPQLAFLNGRLLAALDEEDRTRLVFGQSAADLPPDAGAPAAITANASGDVLLATLSGQIFVLRENAGGLTVSQPWTPEPGGDDLAPAPVRLFTPQAADGSRLALTSDGQLLNITLAGGNLTVTDQGHRRALGLGPRIRLTEERRPRDWPNFTEADLAFSFLPPGDLVPGSGTGLADGRNWAPDIEFPIGEHPAWLNSHVYSPGGGAAGGDQCDARNFAYPWRDAFCETRTSRGENSSCPDPMSVSEVRIRAGTPLLCREMRRSSAEARIQVPVIAVDDGMISGIEAYTVTLDAGDRDYRYRHLNKAALAVTQGQVVKKGDLIGYLSNDFGGTSTTLGISFEIRIKRAQEPPQSVSPYVALVEAYDRRLARVARDKGLAYESPLGKPVQQQSEASQGSDPARPGGPVTLAEIERNARFLKAWSFTQEWEGGYSDDRNDPGGRINLGVGQKEYDLWRARRGLELQPVRGLTRDEAVIMAFENHWLSVRADELPEPVDLILFDSSVNSGSSSAIRMLQRALNQLRNNVAVDGVMSPRLIRAVSQADPQDLGEAILRERLSHYERIVARDPSLKVFSRGWQDRVLALATEAGITLQVDPYEDEILRPGDVFRDRIEGAADIPVPEMVVLPEGGFTMGSPATEAGRFDDEGPQRRVRIGYQFAVSRHEVTWAEWDACVSDGGCDDGPVAAAGGDEGWGRGSRPAINVSWEDAEAYASWLSRRTGETYRLLSEAEWEYAARAGSQARWSFGEDESRLASFGWYDSNSDSRTQPVGGKGANAFGLHDMHGNVWEWVEDCYEAGYSAQPSDGSAFTKSSCSDRVNRGGSWSNTPQGLRSANRVRNAPGYRISLLGFRLARALP